jgi:3'(2'), 5'-bisphosphate nucleotidase
MSLLQAELEIALAAVADACKLSEAVARSLNADSQADKADQSPVTVADFGVQAVINDHLCRAFPDDPIVAEEDGGELSKPENTALRALVNEQVRKILPGRTDAEIIALIDRGHHGGGTRGRFWTLDPIDGTKGFLRGDQYAIALALIEHGRPVLGVLGCPRLNGGSIFSATGPGSACKYDLAVQNKIRASVSWHDKPSQAVFCEPFEAAHSAHDVSRQIMKTLRSNAMPRRLDSQAKYAVVATGLGDVYLRLPVKAGYEEKIWDHAAGVVLVEAAGGRVTDIHGKALDFSLGRTLAANQGVIATNGLLHEPVRDAIVMINSRAEP